MRRWLILGAAEGEQVAAGLEQPVHSVAQRVVQRSKASLWLSRPRCPRRRRRGGSRPSQRSPLEGDPVGRVGDHRVDRPVGDLGAARRALSAWHDAPAPRRRWRDAERAGGHGGRSEPVDALASGSRGCAEDRRERPARGEVLEQARCEICDVRAGGERRVGGAEGEHGLRAALQRRARRRRRAGRGPAGRRGSARATPARLPAFGGVGVQVGVAGQLGGEGVDGLGGAVELEEARSGRPARRRAVLQVGEDRVGDHHRRAVRGRVRSRSGGRSRGATRAGRTRRRAGGRRS